MDQEPLLEVEGIVKTFAGLTALNGVSFRVRKGDLLGLIGPNGAGKSVMVNTITGMYRPTKGTVRYKKEDITGLRADLIVRKRINRTFQNSTLFFELPVIENISLGVPRISEVGLAEAVLKTGSNHRKECQIREHAEKILDLLKLGRHAFSVAGSLPYGLQKVVGIGIALAGDPELLLLDEPLTGLISAEVDEVMECIDRVNAAGVTVVVIEHNMRAVMNHCNRIVVLNFGAKIAEGTSEEIQRDPEVIRSYLGEHNTASATKTQVVEDSRNRHAGTAAMLELDQIVVKYGAAVALHGISLEVGKGDCVALLGANGAGKSTIVNAVSGTVPLASGSIRFEGSRIDGIPAHKIVKLGIGQIPEGRLVFPKMTVWENLELGASALIDRHRKDELREQVLSLFPRLKARLMQKAGTMSGGEQEMLAFGRALMSDPKLILSDEVSMGLAPIVVRDIYDTLMRINRELGVTLLIVEQDAKLALSLARVCYVLETGRIVAGGLSEDLARDDVVRKVYLGEEQGLSYGQS